MGSDPTVYVPYVPARLEAATQFAVEASGLPYEYIDVSDSDTAYWRLLRDLWSRKRTFLLVEHDIVPPDGVLAAMATCDDGDWHGCPYPVGNIFGVFHGCTAYGAGVIRRNPDAVRGIPEPHRAWHSLDSMVIAGLNRREKVGPHVHWPAADHLNHLRHEADHVFANCGDCGGPLRWADLRVGPDLNRCPRCGRIPSYFGPAQPRPPQRRRNPMATNLKYVGSGQYLNGVPADDIETDDPELVAQALESGLYVEAKAAKAPKAGKSQADPAQDASDAPSGGDNADAPVA